MNLAEFLIANARARPGHPALIQDGRTVDYEELRSRVARSAARLAEHDIGRGDVVGLCLGDDIEHIVMLFALAMMGAVILPMDQRWQVVEKRQVATAFQAKIVLCQPGNELSDGPPCLKIDSAWHAALERTAAFDGMVQGHNLPLLISLSSGTSGTPKGPLISHENMLARFHGNWVSLGFNQHDRFLLTTPLYYGGGRGFSMSYLTAGGTVIMRPPPFSAAEIVRVAEEEGATTAFLVPTQLLRLLDLPPQDSPLLNGLRLLVSSGSALTPAQRNQVRSRLSPNFYDYYSSTEGGGISVQPPGDQERFPHSVGRPVHLVDVAVVNDADTPLPAGEVGRIRYRGPGVANAFYRPAKSGGADHGGAYFRDGWFYPGDLGSLNENGYLFLRGRAKDVIIRGGVNIYPADIEDVLAAHPAVCDAAVVAAPSVEFGEDVVAFVVTAADALDEADVIRYCRENLAPYKVPRAVHLIDALPTNSSGKVAKNELLRMLTTVT